MGKSYSVGLEHEIRRNPVAEFRTTAYVHDVAGDEPRLIRKQEGTRIGDRVRFGAVTERMNFIKIALNRSGVGLFSAPFAGHRRPDTGRTHGVHTNAVLRVVQ